MGKKLEKILTIIAAYIFGGFFGLFVGMSQDIPTSKSLVWAFFCASIFTGGVIFYFFVKNFVDKFTKNKN
jgi:hypothetical protein